MNRHIMMIFILWFSKVIWALDFFGCFYKFVLDVWTFKFFEIVFLLSVDFNFTKLWSRNFIQTLR